MSYTQDQINGMSMDQLKAAIAELQGQQVPATPATAPAADTTNSVQTDIDKIEAKIASLKEDGEELYADAIAALEAKRDEMVAEAKAEIDQVETEIKTFEQKFREKHGVSVWVAGIGGGYIVWQVVAAIGRVLGVL